MNAPDGDLEAALRRELSAAVGQVDPGADALERIRARTGKRPPLPWLLSVLAGIVTRARYWVWRGHWVWPDSLPKPRLTSLTSHTRSRGAGSRGAGSRGAGRPAGVGWLRPVAVLAGVAFIATITLAVPPLRQAIVQVGNNGQSPGGAGTDGKGSPGGSGGAGTLTNGARNSSTAGPNGGLGSVSPSATPTSRCQPAATGSGQAGSSSQIAAAVSSALPVTTSAACPQPSGTATPTSSPSLTVPTRGPSLTPLRSPTSAPASSSSATPTATAPSPSATGTGTASPTSSPSAAAGSASS